jgi:hypothetical protein
MIAMTPTSSSRARRVFHWIQLMSFVMLGAIAAPACGQSLDVAQLQLPAAAAAEGSKSALPVHIVLDPNKVPESVTATGRDQRSLTVTNLRAFVERDIQRTLASFFDHVDVVDPGFEQPGEWYLVAEVEISSLRLMSANGGKALRGRMEWSFVLRAAGREQHIYKSSGTTGGDVSRGDGRGALQATFEAALDKLARAYVERDIRGRVARLEQSLPRG